MFDKSFLVNKIVNTLQKNEFEVFLTHGCFDIAARRGFLVLIKTLINVDGLTEEQALSLRAISYFVSAYPFVISVKNNREFLDDKTVYSRFDLPVVTPKLFEEVLVEEDMSAIQSAKGRHTTEINTFVLREKRKELEYSLEVLARIIGISKKALYEIENMRVTPKEETVKKLENMLGVELRIPYEMKSSVATYLKPKNEFQDKVSKEFSRIGIDNTSVYSAPFEIIGKEDFSLITGLSKNTSEIKKEATIVRKLSSILCSRAIFIAKKSHEKTVEGIPIFLDSELPEIESSKEFSEIMREKSVI
jgi:putative transcriptional regulator